MPSERDADAELQFINQKIRDLESGYRRSIDIANEIHWLRRIAARLNQPSVPAEVVEGMVEAATKHLRHLKRTLENRDQFDHLRWLNEPLRDQIDHLQSALTRYEQWKAKHGKENDGSL